MRFLSTSRSLRRAAQTSLLWGNTGPRIALGHRGLASVSGYTKITDARHTRRCSGGGCRGPLRQVLAAKRITDAWPDRTNHPPRTEPSLRSCCRQLRDGNSECDGRERGKNAEHAHDRQFPARQEIPWARDHGVQQHSQAAPAAISSLRSRTLPRGEAPARRGSGRPGSTHLAADHSPKPRPAARQRRCSTRQSRSSQPKSLKRSPLSAQGQPATAAPGHARGLLADVNNVRKIYR